MRLANYFKKEDNGKYTAKRFRNDEIYYAMAIASTENVWYIGYVYIIKKGRPKILFYISDFHKSDIKNKLASFIKINKLKRIGVINSEELPVKSAMEKEILKKDWLVYAKKVQRKEVKQKTIKNKNNSKKKKV